MSLITSPMLLEETAEQIASALEALAISGAADSDEQDWKGVQTLVRQGLGPKAFPIGTQFRVKKETAMTASMGAHSGITGVTVTEETFLSKQGVVGNGVHEFKFDGTVWKYGGETAVLTEYGLAVTGTPADGDEVIVTEAYTEILFDVVDHKTVSGKPRMVLLMHDVWSNRPFDSTEAIYYAESALAAGSYKITVADDPWKSENNVAHYFTLTQAVPAGGQIVFPGGYDAVFNSKSAKTYSGPNSGSAIETVTITTTAIAGATDLGTTGSGNANHIQRAKAGSNNYKESAVRQWINSMAAANAWWSGTNIFDRPSGYANEAGLLHGMDSDFLDVIAETEVKCGTNNTFELPGWTKNAAYTVKDKFYLASRPEVGLGAESMDQGSAFAAYNGVTDADRIKRDSGGTARNWWLRSPTPSNAYGVRLVYSTGALDGYDACLGHSVAAACVIG